MNKQFVIFTLAAMVSLGACKEKKQTEDIIAPKVEKAQPSGPISMQPYHDTRNVKWLDKDYTIDVQRHPDDSLRKVKDESGQLFVDNRISVIVRRSDGSVAISKTFTKANFENFIGAKYRTSGILEGLVFDEVDGNHLEFAASVSLPQTDEYIPLEVKIDNFGKVTIELDSEMDTSGNEIDDEVDDEDDD